MLPPALPESSTEFQASCQRFRGGFGNMVSSQRSGIRVQWKRFSFIHGKTNMATVHEPVVLVYPIQSRYVHDLWPYFPDLILENNPNVGRKPDSVWECKVQSAYVFKKIQSPGQHAQFHTRNWLTVLKRPFLSNTMLMGVHVNMGSMSNMWLVLSSNHNLQFFSSGKFNKYN